MHSFKYNGFHTPASPKHSGTIPSKSVRLKQGTMFVSGEQGAVVLFSIEVQPRECHPMGFKQIYFSDSRSQQQRQALQCTT